LGREPVLHPVQISLGPTLIGLAPPIPDGRDRDTVIHGSLRRFCVKPPVAVPELHRKFRKFVRKWLRENLKPLSEADVLTYAEWLSQTNYPQWRKDELLKEWERNANNFSGGKPMVGRRFKKLGSFCKVETYPKYKAARAINARSDAFKNFTGRFFKSIENKLFELPWFIKHIPVCERSEYMKQVFVGWSGPYYQTDYSHFESHFTKEYLHIAEFQLYKYMLSAFPQEMEQICGTMAGVNRCSFNEFEISVEACRMSGEMCTSLGNGFSNLMNTLFLVELKSGSYTHCTGVVEGDDGLFASRVPLTKDDYKSIGFDIKIEECEEVLTASFCGIVASVDGSPLADPRQILLNFGWSHSPTISASERVRKGLLRAKALSLLYEHPNCPIITPFALRYVHLTDGSEPIWSSNWYERMLEKEVKLFAKQTLAAAKRPITGEVRSQFERLYNIDVVTQMKIEQNLSTYSLNVIQDTDLLLLYRGIEFDDARDYYSRYVMPITDSVGRCCSKPVLDVTGVNVTYLGPRRARYSH
jgi:hypothetical protein